MLLHNGWFNNEIKEKLNQYLKTNQNKHTTTQPVGHRETCSDSEVHINKSLPKKIEKSHINNLAITETRETTVNKIKIRTEINDIETKKTIK